MNTDSADYISFYFLNLFYISVPGIEGLITISIPLQSYLHSIICNKNLYFTITPHKRAKPELLNEALWSYCCA